MLSSELPYHTGVLQRCFGYSERGGTQQEAGGTTQSPPFLFSNMRHFPEARGPSPPIILPPFLCTRPLPMGTHWIREADENSLHFKKSSGCSSSLRVGFLCHTVLAKLLQIWDGCPPSSPSCPSKSTSGNLSLWLSLGGRGVV